MTTTTGVQPVPHDPGAEAAVLGSLILDSDRVEQAKRIVSRHDFFLREHQAVWDTIVALASDGGAVDGLLVREHLECRNQLGAIGGPDYLRQILESVPSSASIEYYAKIVRDRAVRREIADAGKRSLDAAYDLTVDIGQALRESREDFDAIGEPAGGAGLATRCAADIVPKQVTWHLLNMIPNSAITLIQGDGGVGKSRLSHCLAAATSTGNAMAGTALRPRAGSVLIFSAEDTPEIIAANLEAEGADRARIHIISDIVSLPGAIVDIKNWLLDHADCRLIIFDTLPSYLGTANANSNSEVRAALTPLAALAAERDLVVLGINHLNKRQDLTHVHRGLGSTAFTALARSVWGVVLDQDDPELRLLGPVKANYSIRPMGMKYRIIDGRVQFEPDPWTGRLDDKVTPRRELNSRVDLCADWLRDRLAGGSVLSTTIFEEADEKGWRKDLCYRAKEKLSIRASRTGFEDGRWYWTLNENGEHHGEE